MVTSDHTQEFVKNKLSGLSAEKRYRGMTRAWFLHRCVQRPGLALFQTLFPLFFLSSMSFTVELGFLKMPFTLHGKAEA